MPTMYLVLWPAWKKRMALREQAVGRRLKVWARKRFLLLLVLVLVLVLMLQLSYWRWGWSQRWQWQL